VQVCPKEVFAQLLWYAAEAVRAEHVIGLHVGAPMDVKDPDARNV